MRQMVLQAVPYSRILSEIPMVHKYLRVSEGLESVTSPNAALHSRLQIVSIVRVAVSRVPLHI